LLALLRERGGTITQAEATHALEATAYAVRGAARAAGNIAERREGTAVRLELVEAGFPGPPLPPADRPCLHLREAGPTPRGVAADAIGITRTILDYTITDLGDRVAVRPSVTPEDNSAKFVHLREE
jgi:hypothetical protein